MANKKKKNRMKKKRIEIPDVIDLLGGSMEAAFRLGLSQSTVSNWTRKGIPEKYWSQIITLTKGRISLVRLHYLNESLRNNVY